MLVMLVFNKKRKIAPETVVDGGFTARLDLLLLLLSIPCSNTEEGEEDK